jgi:hypothetical protein
MTDINYGPYETILHKLALARQGKTGESYEQAFAEVSADPANVMLRDGLAYDYLARPIYEPYQKPRFPWQEGAKEFFGPANEKIKSMALDYQRDHPAADYAQALSIVSDKPENAALRGWVRVENLIATS